MHGQRVAKQTEWAFWFEFATDGLARQREFYDSNPGLSLYEEDRPWNSLLSGVRGADALAWWG